MIGFCVKCNTGQKLVNVLNVLKININDTGSTVIDVFLVSLLSTENMFHTPPSVFISNFRSKNMFITNYIKQHIN